MSKSHVQLVGDVSKALATLRKEIPDTMQGFNAMAKSSLQDAALSELHKELIALAIAVSQRCDACIGFHIKALIRLGATREQIMETLGVCTYMGGGPALMYAGETLKAWDDLAPAKA